MTATATNNRYHIDATRRRIDAAYEAWRASQPSDICKVMMLAFLMGLLKGLEQDGELSPTAVREIERALERHT